MLMTPGSAMYSPVNKLLLKGPALNIEVRLCIWAFGLPLLLMLLLLSLLLLLLFHILKTESQCSADRRSCREYFVEYCMLDHHAGCDT